MKFKIVGLFLLFSFLMVGQNNLAAQSCKKICFGKSEVKVHENTNILAVSMESETVEKKCSKPCTKLAKTNSNEVEAVFASNSALSKADDKKCIKTCIKTSEASANTTKSVLASYTDKPEANNADCDPSDSCDPKNCCDPSNCLPSQCKTVEKFEKSNFSFLANIFKANPDCKSNVPAARNTAVAVQ